VTIGIGVLCDGGETAILASDMRVSYRGSAAPSDRGGKQYDFPPFTLAVAIAGRVSINASVASEMAYQLSGLLAAKRKFPNELIVAQHIHRIINRSRKKELRVVQECAMLARLGISLEDWQCGKLRDARKLDDLALRYGLQVLREARTELKDHLGIIAAGFVENGIVFVRAIGAELLEEAASPPIYVVGTGSRAAMDVLSKREQSIDCTMARSLLHVYEALRAARRSEPETVGPPAAYVVLRAESHRELPGISRFPAESHLLRAWCKAYRKRTSTQSLDTLAANHQVKCLFRGYRPRPGMVLTHETFDCTAIQPPKID
jgi:hypothetical protein